MVLSGSEGGDYLDTGSSSNSSSGGGDYLDTGSSSNSSSKRFCSAGVVVGGVSRELSCSESVLWTTNCPLVLACCGLEAVVTFSGHFHTVVTLHFRIQSVFLFSYKIHA